MFTPARLAAAHKPEILSIARPFSNFRWAGNRFGSMDTLQRILSQIHLHDAQTMIVETLRAGTSTDIKEENEDLRKRLSQQIRSTTYRLSFFKTLIPHRDALPEVSPADVLGYAVAKCDEHALGRSRIYESVIRSNGHKNNYVRGKQTWEFAVANHQFRVDGYIYAQQNGITNCCAHVALRTAAARFKDMSYRQMNDLMQIDHIHCQLGQGGNCLGVTTEQMVAVLEHIGARCNVADYQKRQTTALPPYQKYVYSSVESGYPAIIAFGTPRDLGHAVPVFGHTFNEDMWVPNAERFYFEPGGGAGYTPSDSWLSSFICHDDNSGSNLCIPRHYLRIRGKRKPQRLPNLGADHVASAIATMPSSVQLSPIRAEALAFEYLVPILSASPTKKNVWIKHLRDALIDDRVILRTIICTAQQYADHLAKARDWDEQKVLQENISDIRKSGNRMFWLVEISIPDLFSANRRKIGEILLDATIVNSSVYNFQNFALARLPGYYTFFDGRTKNGKVKFDYVPCALTSHIELFDCEERALA